MYIEELGEHPMRLHPRTVMLRPPQGMFTVADVALGATLFQSSSPYNTLYSLKGPF